MTPTQQDREAAREWFYANIPNKPQVTHLKKIEALAAFRAEAREQQRERDAELAERCDLNSGYQIAADIRSAGTGAGEKG